MLLSDNLLTLLDLLDLLDLLGQLGVAGRNYCLTLVRRSLGAWKRASPFATNLKKTKKSKKFLQRFIRFCRVVMMMTPRRLRLSKIILDSEGCDAEMDLCRVWPVHELEVPALSWAKRTWTGQKGDETFEIFWVWISVRQSSSTVNWPCCRPKGEKWEAWNSAGVLFAEWTGCSERVENKDCPVSRILHLTSASWRRSKPNPRLKESKKCLTVLSLAFILLLLMVSLYSAIVLNPSCFVQSLLCSCILKFWLSALKELENARKKRGGEDGEVPWWNRCVRCCQMLSVFVSVCHVAVASSWIP